MPVSASSFQAGNYPFFINDGDSSTRWSASSSSFPQTIKIDLLSAVNIDKIFIDWYNSTSRAYKYKIEISTDNSNFTTVVDKTGNTAFQDTTDTFNPINARYVRVTIAGCTASGAYASIYEMQIYNN